MTARIKRGRRGLSDPGPSSSNTPEPSTIPVGVGPNIVSPNEGTRISPREHKDSNSKSYWEKMQFANVANQSGGRPTRIDVDRDGGVFLDHGELADLLQSGTIDEVIRNVQMTVDTAKHTIADNCRQDSDYYKWAPKKHR